MYLVNEQGKILPRRVTGTSSEIPDEKYLRRLNERVI